MPRGGRRLSATLAALALDVGALRESRPFRRVTAGQLVSLVGRQITVVAVPYQMYVMTRSPVLVGLLGLAQVVPLITVSLIGGGIADRVDRRLLLLWTQAMLALCSVALLVGALVHVGAAFLFVVVALIGAVSALDQPTRTAILPSLVSQERLAGAISINIAIFQASLVAGPALGGLVIARLGLAGAYLVDVATFTAALTAIALLPPLPPHSTAREPALAALRRGLAFIVKQPVIVGGYAMDLMRDDLRFAARPVPGAGCDDVQHQRAGARLPVRRAGRRRGRGGGVQRLVVAVHAPGSRGRHLDRRLGRCHPRLRVRQHAVGRACSCSELPAQPTPSARSVATPSCRR